MHCGKGVRMLLIISWKVSLWGGGWGVRVAGFFFGGVGGGGGWEGRGGEVGTGRCVCRLGCLRCLFCGGRDRSLGCLSGEVRLEGGGGGRGGEYHPVIC